VKARIHPVQPSRRSSWLSPKSNTSSPFAAPDGRPRNAGLRFPARAWPERGVFPAGSVENATGGPLQPSSAGTVQAHLSATRHTITEGKKVTHTRRIFAVLRNALGGHKPPSPGLPPFTAGALASSLDAVRQIDACLLAKDELGFRRLPLFFDEVLAFDHVRKQIWLVSPDSPRKPPTPI